MSVKISAMTAIGTLAAEDLFEVVDDPSVTPLSRKATGQQIVDLVNSTTDLSSGTDNYIPTSDGASGWTWDANLTFDGSKLAVGSSGVATGQITVTGSSQGSIHLYDSGTGEVQGTDDLLILKLSTQAYVWNESSGGLFLGNAGATMLELSGTVADFQDNNITTSGNISTAGGNFQINQVGNATPVTEYIDSDASQAMIRYYRRGTSNRIATGVGSLDDWFVAHYDGSGVYQGDAIVVENLTGDVTIGNDLFVDGTLSAGDEIGASVINSNADDLVIKATTGSPGMTLHSSDYSNGNIYFSDPLSSTAGYINYAHGSDTMTFGSAGANQLTISATTADFQDNEIVTTNSIRTTGGSFQVNRSGDAATAAMYLDADAGQNTELTLRTGTSTRWKVVKQNDAESGSDAGSPFAIERYNDSGVYQDSALSINRASGDVTIPNDLILGANSAIFTDSGSDFRLKHNGGLIFDVDLDNSGGESFVVRGAATSDVLLDLSVSGGANFQDSNITTSGNITTTGGELSVDRTGDAANAIINIDADASSSSNIRFQTAGVNQWQIVKDGSEDINIWRYIAGVFQDSAFKITNSSGNVTIANDLSLTGGDLSVSSGTITSITTGGNVLNLYSDQDNASVQVSNFNGRRGLYGTPADNDEIKSSWWLYNSANQNIEAVRITAIATDVTDTTEDSAFELSTTRAGSVTTELNIGGGTADFQDNTIVTTGDLQVGTNGTVQATSWTPTITAQSGSITTSSSTCSYSQIGDVLYIQGSITITTKGTASGYLQFTLPNSVTAVNNGAFYLVEGTTSNLNNVGFVYASQNYVRVFGTEGSFATPFVADGDVFFFSATILLATP